LDVKALDVLPEMPVEMRWGVAADVAEVSQSKVEEGQIHPVTAKEVITEAREYNEHSLSRMTNSS
jgi:hypothetical protein